MTPGEVWGRGRTALVDSAASTSDTVWLVHRPSGGPTVVPYGLLEPPPRRRRGWPRRMFFFFFHPDGRHLATVVQEVAAASRWIGKRTGNKPYLTGRDS